MDNMVEFIIDNYTWFVIGVVVLIFALIGFIFEQDYKKKLRNGKNIQTNNIEKNTSVEKEEVQIVNEDTKLDDITENYEQDNANIAVDLNNYEENINVEEQPLEVLNVIEEPLDYKQENNYLVTEDNLYDLPTDENVENIEQSDMVINNDILENNNLESVIDEFKLDDFIEEEKYNDNYNLPSNEEIQLPNIESLADNYIVEDDDDVWKF